MTIVVDGVTIGTVVVDGVSIGTVIVDGVTVWSAIALQSPGFSNVSDTGSGSTKDWYAYIYTNGTTKQSSAARSDWRVPAGTSNSGNYEARFTATGSPTILGTMTENVWHNLGSNQTLGVRLPEGITNMVLEIREVANTSNKVSTSWTWSWENED